MKDVKLFHAGTKQTEEGTLLSTGGRVLGVMGLGDTIEKAQIAAYQAVEAIDWKDGFCRRDIGWRAIAAQKIKAA